MKNKALLNKINKKLLERLNSALDNEVLQVDEIQALVSVYSTLSYLPNGISCTGGPLYLPDISNQATQTEQV